MSDANNYELRREPGREEIEALEARLREKDREIERLRALVEKQQDSRHMREWPILWDALRERVGHDGVVEILNATLAKQEDGDE